MIQSQKKKKRREEEGRGAWRSEDLGERNRIQGGGRRRRGPGGGMGVGSDGDGWKGRRSRRRGRGEGGRRGEEETLKHSNFHHIHTILGVVMVRWLLHVGLGWVGEMIVF